MSRRVAKNYPFSDSEYMQCTDKHLKHCRNAGENVSAIYFAFNVIEIIELQAESVECLLKHIDVNRQVWVSKPLKMKNNEVISL